MSRTTTAAFDAAVASGHIVFIVLVELYYDSGTIYLAHAPNNVVWNGNTYVGIASIGTLETVQEASELEATGLVGTMVANPANIAAVLLEDIQGRKVIVRVALYNSSYTILADPVIVFQGRLDTMTVELGEEAKIKLTAESRFAAWDTPKVRRWNSPDQQVIAPTDAFFDYIPQMVSRQLPWGVPGAPAPAVSAASTLGVNFYGTQL